MTEDSDQENAINSEWNPARDQSGKFLPGAGGRPPGAKNKKTRASVMAINSLQDLAFQKLKELLEAGNPSTVEFVVKSLLPTGGRAVQLEDMSVEGLSDAVASGTISPTELRQLASGLEKIRAVEDMDKLADRLAEVERLLKDG
ncbi:hypothetical protein [Paracoccus sp. AS002]|uniref:hypothetical protein n=1 Tax=Paracoccus sp. AS002 TaxID=3019545 RepID=UPI0023E79AC4|nr:hypothetical protein [Paracoccus sp. AS002]MDF3905534.1 hypothetical protein [Paracoccus sp. AS002]